MRAETKKSKAGGPHSGLFRAGIFSSGKISPPFSLGEKERMRGSKGVAQKTLVPGKFWAGALILAFFFTTPSFAAEKVWTGATDTDWHNEDNWNPASVPGPADNVVVDLTGAAVVVSQTFQAKTLTVGGLREGTVTSENFIFGTVAPAAATDVAIENRKEGVLTLQGAGTLTLTGAYKDSEETLSSEPSFLFWLE